jgi:hypothetical protein
MQKNLRYKNLELFLQQSIIITIMDSNTRVTKSYFPAIEILDVMEIL